MSSGSLKKPTTNDRQDTSITSEKATHDPPKKGDIFDVLGNQRRRFVLHYLRSEDGPVALTEVAEQVAAWENECSQPELKYEQRKRVYSALQQVHLPRMDSAGVLDFDKARGLIRPSDEFASFSVYLEVDEGPFLNNGVLYLSLAGIAVLLTLGSWMQIQVLNGMPPLAIAATVIFLFGITSIYRLVMSQEFTIDPSDPPPELNE